MNLEDSKEVLAAMVEIERELVAAGDAASKEAAAQASNNDSYRFLIGVSIGFDRALQIIRRKLAAFPGHTKNST